MVLLSKKNSPAGHDQLPERVIQVGEGRFLRAFVDWMINELNERRIFNGSIVVVAPRPSGGANLARLGAQDNLYTVWQRGYTRGGIVDRKELVSSISRCIDPYKNWSDFIRCAENPEINIFVSNTTEAGLVYKEEPYAPDKPLQTFPAKLTAYLYHRFKHFDGERAYGMVVVPCELVDDNGDRLKGLVLQYAHDWQLPAAFISWLEEANYFCNTLVDRIVSGVPEQDILKNIFDEMGYEDYFLTVCEPFHLWAVQDGGRLRAMLPLDRIGLNVHYVDDVAPYRLQKVRILNGTHTLMTPLSLLYGRNTVFEAVNNEFISRLIRRMMFKEIIPVLDFAESDLKQYADSVLERFSNPFIRHNLNDIMLNALSKFTVRVLPTIKEYVGRFKTLPPLITLCSAAFLLYYRQKPDACLRADSHPDLNKLLGIWSEEEKYGLEETVSRILGLETIWGEDLNALPGLCRSLSGHIRGMRSRSVEEYVNQMVEEVETGEMVE